MDYSSFTIISFFILLIINYDIFFKPCEKFSEKRSYRHFLLCILVYYITDILWGILYGFKLIKLTFADTSLYFFTMAASVFLGTRFITEYLGSKNKFGQFLKIFGALYLIFETLILVVNFFRPVMFWFDKKNVYCVGNGRYITLIIQVFLFFFTTLQTFYAMTQNDTQAKKRYLAIGIFSIMMIIFIVLQCFYPFFPFYAIGALFGTCFIHTFVVESEKDEIRQKLENLLQVEQIQEAEIGNARLLAYNDPLTGVKSKGCYLEDVICLDKRIEDKILKDFAIAVFDVNNLKKVNDTLGHEAGDKLLKEAANVICTSFAHSPVYRIGGDEFVVFLKNEDYDTRDEKIKAFNEKIEKNLLEDKVVISCGFDKFIPEKDKCYAELFSRADKNMYERKAFLKQV